MLIRLAGLILPLGLDTFAVALSLGIAPLGPRRRLQISLVFTGFELGMPVLGFFTGQLVGRVAGEVANYLAIGLLLALGVWTFSARGREKEHTHQLQRLDRMWGWTALALGVSVSLDELAIGFTLGLLGLPILLVLVLIGLQTFFATQVGLRLGHVVGLAVGEAAERVAGTALVFLGLYLLSELLLRRA